MGVGGACADDFYSSNCTEQTTLSHPARETVGKPSPVHCKGRRLEVLSNLAIFGGPCVISNSFYTHV
jgi:hypothetical protein